MSSYTEGQVHQLMEKLEAEGFAPSDITKLGQYKRISEFLGVLYGTHEISPVANSDRLKIINDWQNFYKETFNRNFYFSKIIIPEKPEGKWRLLVVADISFKVLYKKCRDFFPCWLCFLCRDITENERDAKKGAYAIWVRDNVEADEDLKNLSACDIKSQKITTETLNERLIHELKFFTETGKPLDIKSVTLCAGSCYSTGEIPTAGYFSGSGLGIDWCRADVTDDCMFPRRVVC